MGGRFSRFEVSFCDLDLAFAERQLLERSAREPELDQQQAAKERMREAPLRREVWESEKRQPRTLRQQPLIPN